MTHVLAAILILAQQTDKDVEQALKTFESAWKKCARDEGGRANAITPLTMYKHDSILDSLLRKLESEKSGNVKEALVKAIGFYTESEKAAEALFDQLDKNKKTPNVMQAAFQGIGSLKPKLSRPHVDDVHEYVKTKDMSVAVPAVRALGCIRHKSSIPILIERLKRAQQDMREYIQGANLPNCDGD
jgi:HEAT repeat protein